MSKMALAAALAAIFMAQGAMAQGREATVPYVSNMGSVANVDNIESLSARVEARLDRLSDAETDQLDQIASAAAARAVLALRCEASGFERISKAVQRMMESKVGQVSANARAAQAYAKDSALMKYKAIARANAGVACGDLDNLRSIAASQGFD